MVNSAAEHFRCFFGFIPEEKFLLADSLMRDLNAIQDIRRHAGHPTCYQKNEEIVKIFELIGVTTAAGINSTKALSSSPTIFANHF